jgi:hypothetical protein
MVGVFYLQASGARGGFDKVAKLDSPSGELAILSKAESPEARSAFKVGRFTYVDGRMVCLFRLDLELWVRVGDFVIRVDDEVRATWDVEGPRPSGPLRGRFRVERAGTTVLDFEHEPFQDRKIIPGDDTPFVDEEDYDFMLLISRVLGEPRRRAAFYLKASQL